METIFDIFDLKAGQDKYAFMQQAVNDPEVGFVLIICNPLYKEKSDNYTGGVGDETQILAPEVYDDVYSTRFVPVIFEKQEDILKSIPTYLKSRIRFDLSDSDTFEKEYERLLRHIFNKPAYHQAKLGKMPSYLEEEQYDYSELRQILVNLRRISTQEKGRIRGLAIDFLEEYLSVMRSYLPSDPNVPNAKWYLEKIDELQIPRDLFISYFIELIYLDPDIATEFLSDFSECLVNIVPSSRNESLAEHLEFHIWEIIVFSVYLLWKNDCVLQIRTFAERTYSFTTNLYSSNIHLGSFSEFRPYLKQIETLNESENGYRIYRSYIGEIVDKHAKPFGITTEDLAFADLLLMQLSISISNVPKTHYWYPMLISYAGNTPKRYGNLQSKRVCSKYLTLFGLHNERELQQFIIDLKEKFAFGEESYYYEQYLIGNDGFLNYIGKYY